MKNGFFTKILALSLVIFTLVSLASCSSKPTMDDIEERIRILKNSWDLKDVYRFDSDDRSDWEYEINEEISLNGEIEGGYELDDETYVFEFESKSDAKKAMKVLEYWENESRYDEFVIMRIDNIVIFGEEEIVDMILND